MTDDKAQQKPPSSISDHSDQSQVDVQIFELQDYELKQHRPAKELYVRLIWGKRKYKTSVKKKDANPVWNHFLVLKIEPEIKELIVQLFSRTWKKDIQLGQTIFATEIIQKEIPMQGLYTLYHKKTKEPIAKLRMAIRRHIPMSPSSQSTSLYPIKLFKIISEPISPDENAEPRPAGCQSRLNELRRSTNVTSIKRVVCSEDVVPFMNDFFSQFQKIKDQLIKLENNNVALRQIYGKYFTATSNDQREKLANKMTQLVDLGNGGFTDLNRAFKILEVETQKIQAECSNLTELSKNAKTSASTLPIELCIRQNMTNATSRIYVNCSLEFYNVQTQYKYMHRKTVRKMFQLANPAATEQELRQAESMDMDTILIQAVAGLTVENAKDALAYVKTRHQEITKIEKGIKEIQRLFNDAAVLVANQAEFVDKIQSNIEIAKISTKEGLEQLRQARIQQNHRFKLPLTSLWKLVH